MRPRKAAQILGFIIKTPLSLNPWVQISMVSLLFFAVGLEPTPFYFLIKEVATG